MAVVVPLEVQSMPLILEVCCLFDEAARHNGSDQTILLAIGVPRAEVLLVADHPLAVRRLVAALRSGHLQVRADLLPECSEHVIGQRVCEMPSVNRFLDRSGRLVAQYAED